MSSFYIKSDKIFLENEIFKGYILIKDGKIADISVTAAENYEIIDYSDCIVCSGYFDTHVHGYGGYDVMDGKPQSIQEISKGIVKTGVTSFLATTLTDSVEKLNKVCEVIGESYKACDGARVQGIFLEGPFFSEKFKGAQNSEYMIEPDADILRNWCRLSDNMVKKIAIAPELKGSEDFIKAANELNVAVALGHSNADYEEAKRAVDLGARIFVHTYNGMSPLHHRNPGMVGAALSTENTYSEIICDGHHVHSAAVKVVLRAKSVMNTMLITDCMMAGGMKDGQYKLGDFDVTVAGGTARLEDGALAGSVLSLSQAVKNVVNWGIATPLEAVNMASIVPAKSLNMDREIGSIDIGKYADLNILNQHMDVLNVYIKGVKKY